MVKPLKVGFDLDGVILYNPVRTLRPVASSLKFLKKLILRQQPDSFYFPKTFIEKEIWRLLHKTSYKIADGVDDIKELAVSGRIEPYIVTARYSFLKEDFQDWIRKLNNKPYFKYYHYNKNNMQPNAFKEHMIRQLGLDVFVEDNWGVIQRLNGALSKTKVLWISNFLDRNIGYPYKFMNLKEAVGYLNNITTG